ncbi:hypothetical protein [Mycetocola zhujimingii]|uniref:hypothetical protein n=1 Tax=Mycetocola zhujimingii TaxID=2079792 RepID=UPI0011B20067|nr:hypothetical protein [Mycetocola zhujimingii]
MNEKRRITPQGLSGFVLFVVILLTSIALAVVSDMNVFARGGIAVAVGIAAAAFSFVLLDKRQNRSRK